jgi:hypothetical protein
MTMARPSRVPQIRLTSINRYIHLTVVRSRTSAIHRQRQDTAPSRKGRRPPAIDENKRETAGFERIYVLLDIRCALVKCICNFATTQGDKVVIGRQTPAGCRVRHKDRKQSIMA